MSRYNFIADTSKDPIGGSPINNLKLLSLFDCIYGARTEELKKDTADVISYFEKNVPGSEEYTKLLKYLNDDNNRNQIRSYLTNPNCPISILMKFRQEVIDSGRSVNKHLNSTNSIGINMDEVAKCFNEGKMNSYIWSENAGTLKAKAENEKQTILRTQANKNDEFSKK